MLFEYSEADMKIDLLKSELKDSVTLASSSTYSKILTYSYSASASKKDEKTANEDKSTLVINSEDCLQMDYVLRNEWDKARVNERFRYSLDEGKLPTKILNGKYNFVIQLNINRAVHRRKAQEINSTNQPFNPAEFNFNKVNNQECLFTIVKSDLKECQTADDSKNNAAKLTILINVSPLEYGHVLLVPNIEKNEPQIITLNGLRAALEFLLLNKSRDFRVGFNSLCGYASVNHHHYHGYYLSHPLFIQHANLNKLAGDCYEFEDENYPAPAFIFLISDLCQVKQVVGNAYKVAQYFQSTNIAHNLVIIRGSKDNDGKSFNAIRLLLWPRTSSFGAKENLDFNPALCELSGHFPLKNAQAFSSLTEEKICEELSNICKDVFNSIKHYVKNLFLQE